MAKNKQLVITEFSRDIKIATEIHISDIPKPGPEDVLIKNSIVGINAIYDRELYRGGVPYINVVFPYVFGVEAVGRVIEIGNKVTRLKLGDAVSTVKVGTAYQEFQILDESLTTKIPDDTPAYLTINPTGISAQLALEKTAELKPGETIVVSAAAGGLGHIIVQLAKFKDCHVVAICGSPEKVALLRSLNSCDRIINYREESVAAVLSNEYSNAIDVAIDSVGQHMFDAFLENLAPKGRLVICGLATELSSEAFQIVNQPRVYESIYWKGASVRCFMNHLFKEDHDHARQALTQLYQANKLKLRHDLTEFIGIESIKDASHYLLEGKSCGKVIVRL